MDLPGPASLRQLRLSVSAEGRGFAYYVSDMTNGKILSISRQVARAFMLFEDVVGGNAKAREKLDETEAREGLKVVTYLRQVRDQERLQGTKFNPLSMQIKLFDVGGFQPALRPLASWLIGWPIIMVFVVLICLAGLIGTQNNWAIASEFQNVFDLAALLTFGLIAPFLKIIHEFGHVLVATRFKVRVRQAGVNLIGLYPLPFVDCTEADLKARRRDRIWISLAGLFTDFLIGLVAFMVWHLADNNAVQNVAGRAFAFATLSSLLFNANPLMKFDGYYAFVDMIGQRNLYARATKSFAGFRKYIGSFGAAGERPQDAGDWAVLGYGLATFCYRIMIMFTIMTMMMPQYLGLGMVLTLWGGYAMFLSPLMRTDRPKPAKNEENRMRMWVNRSIFLMLLGLLMVAVKLPFVRVVPLHLDQMGQYGVSVQSDGFLQAVPQSNAVVPSGAPLVRMQNDRFVEEAGVLALEEAEADLLVTSTSGVSAAQSRAARDKLASVQSRQVALERDMINLSIVAPEEGLFVSASERLHVGQFVTSGRQIGAFYPTSGTARLIGAFPERMVETFQTSETVFELWDEESYANLPKDRIRLVEAINVDQQTGLRSFQLQVQLNRSPAALVGRDVQLMLDFGSRPVWEHIRFWVDGQIAAFRDAQLTDQSKRLGGS